MFVNLSENANPLIMMHGQAKFHANGSYIMQFLLDGNANRSISQLLARIMMDFFRSNSTKTATKTVQSLNYTTKPDVQQSK